MNVLEPGMGIYNDDTAYLAMRFWLQLDPLQFDDEYYVLFYPAADSSGTKIFSPSLSAAEREPERKRVVKSSSNGSSLSSKQFAAVGPAGDDRGPPADAPP